MIKAINKTINLALQGGGAHGALAWGILDKLLEDGRLSFDSISATSAGAMNAAVLAEGFITGGNEGAREALAKFWKMISEAGELYSPIKLSPWETLFDVKIDQSTAYGFFDLMSKMYSPYQLNPLNMNPLREVLEKVIHVENIRASKKIKLFLSATNVKTGKIKIFENKDLSIDAIMASACIPSLFQAVNIKDDYFWDGGYMGNPAIFPLIYNSDYRDILIIHINPIYRDAVPESAADILNRMNEISFNSSLMREMRAIDFVSKMLDNGWIKEEFKNNIHRYYMHAIRADIAMQTFSVASKLDVRWSFISRLFEEGRMQGAAWLKKNFHNLGKKTTIDMDEYL